MKKILKMVAIICIMAVFFCAHIIWANAAVTESVWDFEDYDKSETALEYLSRIDFYHVQGNVGITTHYLHGKMVKLEPGARIILWKHPGRPGEGVPIEDNFAMEFDFMQSSKAPIEDLATTSCDPWINETRACRIYSDGTDIKLGHRAGNLILIENYKANTLYNIKVAYNFENETIRVWVNDIAVFTETKLYFMNSIANIGRFDFKNTATGAGSVNIGKFAIHSYTDATKELDELKEAIFNVKNLSETFVSGDYLGEYDRNAMEELRSAVALAEKNLFKWQNEISPDKEEIAQMTAKVNTAFEKAQKSKITEFVDVYDMDFDTKNLEEGGWHLVEVTPGEIVSDDGNNVYKGTSGTRGLRFFKTPYTQKATIAFSFRQDVKAPVSKISEITSYSYNDNHRLYTISSDGTDVLINGKTMIENYEADKWYDIRIETDPVTKELRVYVDKKRVLKELILSYIGKDATVIGRWETAVGKQNSEILIDNIRIYRDVDSEFGEFAAELVNIFGDKTSVTQNLSLPENKDGYSISWSSSDASVISDSGTVSRSKTENKTVTLTALISRDGYTYKRNYPLAVPRISASEEGEADLVIEERTGHSGREFFRRGIPFAKGELSADEKISLKCGDTIVPVQTEILEKHTDGSVKWLSVSFMWDVEANTSYDFYIVKEDSPHTKTASGTLSGETATLKNDSVTATVTKNGVTQILYNGTNILGAGGISLYAENTYKFNADSISVVSQGPVYSTVRLTGKFQNSNVAGDWLITLYAGDSRLYHEFRFTAKGDQYVNSQTMNLSFNGFSNPVYESDAPSENGLTESDYVILNNGNTYVMLTSKDVTRFSGAIETEGVHNGFMCYGNAVTFAPIQYNTEYQWLDGITRTVRLDMSFYNSSPTENDTAREEAWAFTPPSLTVNSGRFVTAGVIEDDNTSPALVRTENLIASMYGDLWHHFQAGKLPHSLEIDYDNEKIVTVHRGARLESSFDRSGGEVEYNLWKSYMTTGNPVMYDLLSESSEYWTDFMVYRGKLDKLIGTNRYQTKDTDHVSFRTNMPFYGDLSGLYMSYLVTGDPYYKESFRMAADFWEKSITDANGVPMLSYWYDNRYPDRLNYNEEFVENPTFQFRFSAMARGMYYAYRLFGDDRYLVAGESIMDHLPLMQLENGSFLESYAYPSFAPWKNVTDDYGNPSYSEKHYIMAYGSRMITDFYNLSGYAPGLSNMVKLADYLNERQGDKGFGWSPNSDDDVYAVPSIRGAGSNSTKMVFVAKLYMATGDEKYLATLAEMFRFYSGSWDGGNTDRVMETGKSTFMEASQTIGRILLDNAGIVSELGFADVIAILQEDTIVRKDLYPEYDAVIKGRNNRFALNAFDTPMGRVVYLNNSELTTYTAENPELYKETAFFTSFKVDTETNLWYGAQNTITPSGVSMNSDVRVVDMISLMKTDVKLNLKGSLAVADVRKYTPEKIEFLINADKKFTISVSDGFFSVTDGSYYAVETDGVQNIVQAENGVINCEIDASGTPQSVEIYPFMGDVVITEFVSGDKVITKLSQVTTNTLDVKVTVLGNAYSENCVAAVYAGEKLYDVKVYDAENGASLTLPQNKANTTVKVFYLNNKLNPIELPIVLK